MGPLPMEPSLTFSNAISARYHRQVVPVAALQPVTAQMVQWHDPLPPHLRGQPPSSEAVRAYLEEQMKRYHWTPAKTNASGRVLGGRRSDLFVERLLDDLALYGWAKKMFGL